MNKENGCTPPPQRALACLPAVSFWLFDLLCPSGLKELRIPLKNTYTAASAHRRPSFFFFFFFLNCLAKSWPCLLRLVALLRYTETSDSLLSTNDCLQIIVTFICGFLPLSLYILFQKGIRNLSLSFHFYIRIFWLSWFLLIARVLS